MNLPLDVCERLKVLGLEQETQWVWSWEGMSEPYTANVVLRLPESNHWHCVTVACPTLEEMLGWLLATRRVDMHSGHRHDRNDGVWFEAWNYDDMTHYEGPLLPTPLLAVAALVEDVLKEKP